MWSKDFFLLMKGVGKVAEQIAKTQLPPLATKSAQITRHVNELSKLGPFLTKTLFHDVKKMGTSGVSDVEATATNIASTLTQNVNPNMSAAEKLQQIDQQIEELAKENISTQYSPKKQHKATVGGSHTHHHLNYEDIRYDPSNHKIQKSHHEEAVKEPLILKEKKTKTTTIQPPKDEQATTVHPTVDTVRHQVEENLPPSYTTNVPHTTPESEQIPNALQTRTWKERHVPSSPISRILGFGSLAAKLAVGTATEIVRTGGKTGARSAFISDSNAEKLAETLCTMRGAALKLGQMLSIQDENLIPSKLADALDRVRQNANVMPKAQLHDQLRQELGDDWRNNFKEFDDVPIAAASIGQVHRATLKNGERVAIKIQYPGVAESIESDLLNLKRLVTYTNILPRGLYIDEIIRVGQEELTLECNYSLEAENQVYFRKLIEESGLAQAYTVPRVYHDLSTSRILTTELISGVAVDKVVHLSQEIRNSISRRILVLTIKELFEWRFMQTDPNWSNFMYNSSTDKVGLIDFGAARKFDKSFVDQYFQIVWSAANSDTETMMKYSLQMGFLTGDESQAMMRAHEAAGMVVGEPFRSSEPFDFHKSQLTKRLAQYTETFMQGRLTPPPQEVYSLHRKLAGAFLMCIKLRAIIPCRDVLEEVYEKYQQQ